MGKYANRNTFVNKPEDFFSMREILKGSIEKSQMNYFNIPKEVLDIIIEKSIFETLNKIDNDYRAFRSVRLILIEEEFENNVRLYAEEYIKSQKRQTKLDMPKEEHKEEINEIEVPKDYASARLVLQSTMNKFSDSSYDISGAEFNFIARRAINDTLISLKKRKIEHISPELLKKEFAVNLSKNANINIIRTPKSEKTIRVALDKAIEHCKNLYPNVLKDDFDLIIYKCVKNISNALQNQPDSKRISEVVIENKFYRYFDKYMNIYEKRHNLYWLIGNDNDKYDEYQFSAGSLDEEEEKYLFKKIQAGDKEAGNVLIEKSAKLSEFRSKNFYGRSMDKEDFIQEGFLGMIRALKKFDPTKGNRFFTYAHYWINQSMSRARDDTDRFIRIPAGMSLDLQKYKRTYNELYSENLVLPTVRQVAKRMKISMDKAEELNALMNNGLVMNEPASLNVKVNVNDSDGETELSDLIEDANENTEEKVMKKLLPYEINKLIKIVKLNEKEKIILTKRYGLNGEEPQTLDAIGKEFDLTRERVRQIELKVLKKLRNNAYIASLADYTDNPSESLENLKQYRLKYRKGETRKNLTLDEPKEEYTEDNHKVDLTGIDFTNAEQVLNKTEMTVIDLLLQNDGNIRVVANMLDLDEKTVREEIIESLKNIKEDLSKNKIKKL